MPQIINTNVASLNAQRNLNTSQSDANKALQRLSSGLRINSAKDDAAGLAISNRLTSQINGINQAIRNSNDGISVAQVAEGALGETTNILQRMRELAIQSANSTNSSADRAALQAEVDELIFEVDRISSSTSFGATKLLDGSFSGQQFQVGAQKGETIGVSIASASSEDLGVKTIDFTGFAAARVGASGAAAASAIGAQSLTFDVNGAETTVAVDAGASAKDVASTVNSDVSGVIATASTVAELTLASYTAGTGEFDVTINGETFNVTAGGAVNSEADLGAAINAANIGVTASVAGSVITLTDVDGDDIVIDDFTTGTGTPTLAVTSTLADGTDSASVTVATTEGVQVTGQIQFSTSLGDDATFALATDNTTGTEQLTSSNTTGAGTGTAALDTTQQVADIDISDIAGANSALDIIDAALTAVDSQRADLGAVQNRLESVISNLANVAENSAAARSRIRDADFAQETAALAKSQILQQAGISVLAQANASSQNVLALLQ